MPPTPGRPARAAAAASSPVAACPEGLRPLARDPWALAAAGSVLPLLLKMRGGRPGEPFADDFLFLDYSVLRGNPSWLGGGGGNPYWRPLARQAYFAVFGPLALTHPVVLAALHALALMAAAVLLHRALRTVWPGPVAAVAGAFPVWLEANRVLVAWPSGAQDLGALLFLALALHAAARGRTALVAVAAVCAALCKEVAGLPALLVPFAPFPAREGVRARARVLPLLALAAWGAARFALPQGEGLGVGALAGHVARGIAPASLLGTAMGSAVLDGLGRVPGARAGPVFSMVLAACALFSFGLFALARARAAATWRWSAWGLAWFAAGAAPLALFVPDWVSFRSLVPAMGLGIALAAPLAAAPWLAIPIVSLRLAALLAAPQLPDRLDVSYTQLGDATSWPRMAALQRGVRDVRRTLAHAAPRLGRESCVARQAFPRMMMVAFQGDLALRAWYRDTTLRWAATEELRDSRGECVAAMIEYEPEQDRQWVAIELPAMREAFAGVQALRLRENDSGLLHLAAAQTAQKDTCARQFMASLEGWRALAQLDLGLTADAEASARRSLGQFSGTGDARIVLARAAAGRGEWFAARELLNAQVLLFPGDLEARGLLGTAESLLAVRVR